MEFIEAVKELEKGKVFKRKSWNRHRSLAYLVKDENTVLKLFAYGRLEPFEMMEEDLFADDWMETEKDCYVLKKIEEKFDGMSYFTIEKDKYIKEKETLNLYEFTKLLRYVNINYEKQCETNMDNIMNPSIIPFDYDFTKCPLCENAIDFDEHNCANCSNGCVSYDVDPQGENVRAQLLGNRYQGEYFVINLYEDGWHKDNQRLIANLKKFEQAICYWRENERFKKRLRRKKRE